MAERRSSTVTKLKNEEVHPTNPKNSTENCKRYYQSQTKHTLGKSTDRISVSIWIATKISKRHDSEAETTVKNVHESWKYHLEKAIDDINDAAPGLHLYQVDSEREDHKICIYGIEEEEAYTMKTIQSQNGAHIYLGDSFFISTELVYMKFYMFWGFGMSSSELMHR